MGDGSADAAQDVRRHARPPAEQDAYFETISADYTQTIDWNVAKEGVNHADVLNFESFMPAYNQTLDLAQHVRTKG